MKRNEKYLIIKGCAGIGNRLFVVSNAIEYCKITKRKLYVDWSDGQFGEKGRNVFYDFFTLKGIDHLVDLEEIRGQESLSYYPIQWKDNLEKSIYDLFEVVEKNYLRRFPTFFYRRNRLSMLNGYWRKITSSNNYGANVIGDMFNPLNSPYGSQLSYNKKENVLVYADFTPFFHDETFLNHIQLTQNLELKVADFSQRNNLNTNTIGIHIRSTDKKPNKSLDVLFAKINNLNLDQPNIFLATDNLLIKDEIIRRYKKVIYFEKKLPEVSNEGIHQWALYNNKPELAAQICEDSIIDMWLLSQCEYLLYQGNSSFSIISKMLHKNKTKAIDWNL